MGLIAALSTLSLLIGCLNAFSFSVSVSSSNCPFLLHSVNPPPTPAPAPAPASHTQKQKVLFFSSSPPPNSLSPQTQTQIKIKINLPPDSFDLYLNDDAYPTLSSYLDVVQFDSIYISDPAPDFFSSNTNLLAASSLLNGCGTGTINLLFSNPTDPTIPTIPTLRDSILFTPLEITSPTSLRLVPHRAIPNLLQFRGSVGRGYGRGGKDLGVPTANLVGETFRKPLEGVDTGVYFGWAAIEGEGEDKEKDKEREEVENGRGRQHKAVVNIGFSPTFKDAENPEKIVEAHIMNDKTRFPFAPPDFYGETMRLQLVGKLRDEKKFDSFPELIAQIKLDVENASDALDDFPFAALRASPFLVETCRNWNPDEKESEGEEVISKAVELSDEGVEVEGGGSSYEFVDFREGVKRTPLGRHIITDIRGGGVAVDVGEEVYDRDVVVFSVGEGVRQLGAVGLNNRGDTSIFTLCCWRPIAIGETDEIGVEFLESEEEDPILLDDDVNNLIVHKILSNDDVILGSRQVGGGMGPGNPHGEESENTYTISPSILPPNIKIVVRPELEIFW